MTDQRKPTQGITVQGSDPETYELVEAEPYHAPTFDVKRLRQSLRHRSDNRNILIDWIRDNLQDGVDYGRLHVVKKDICPDGPRCRNPYHFSKPSLWKPGAEKICGMLGWSVTFPDLADLASALMANANAENIIVRCVIYNGAGQVVGEGIGARALSKDFGDINKALKMAKKSAHIDATLVAAGLSEVFTQDMETDAKDQETGDTYNPGVAPGDNAFERTRNINVETHCPIGKGWRGRKWEEVDFGFLEWIVDTIDDKPDLVKRAQKEIGLRAQPSPDPEPPSRPGSELATHARAVSLAKSLDELESAWTETPEQYHRALTKAYEMRKTELTGKADQ